MKRTRRRSNAPSVIATPQLDITPTAITFYDPYATRENLDGVPRDDLPHRAWHAYVNLMGNQTQMQPTLMDLQRFKVLNAIHMAAMQAAEQTGRSLDRPLVLSTWSQPSINSMISAIRSGRHSMVHLFDPPSAFVPPLPINQLQQLLDACHQVKSTLVIDQTFLPPWLDRGNLERLSRLPQNKYWAVVRDTSGLPMPTESNIFETRKTNRSIETPAETLTFGLLSNALRNKIPQLPQLNAREEYVCRQIVGMLSGLHTDGVMQDLPLRVARLVRFFPGGPLPLGEVETQLVNSNELVVDLKTKEKYSSSWKTIRNYLLGTQSGVQKRATIVGGGIAGIAMGIELETHGVDVTVIDDSIKVVNGRIQTNNTSTVAGAQFIIDYSESVNAKTTDEFEYAIATSSVLDALASRPDAANVTGVQRCTALELVGENESLWGQTTMTAMKAKVRDIREYGLNEFDLKTLNTEKDGPPALETVKIKSSIESNDSYAIDTPVALGHLQRLFLASGGKIEVRTVTPKEYAARKVISDTNNLLLVAAGNRVHELVGETNKEFPPGKAFKGLRFTYEVKPHALSGLRSSLIGWRDMLLAVHATPKGANVAAIARSVPNPDPNDVSVSPQERGDAEPRLKEMIEKTKAITGIAPEDLVEVEVRAGNRMSGPNGPSVTRGGMINFGGLGWAESWGAASKVSESLGLTLSQSGPAVSMDIGAGLAQAV